MVGCEAFPCISFPYPTSPYTDKIIHDLSLLCLPNLDMFIAGSACES